jgi:hypothetical protein
MYWDRAAGALELRIAMGPGAVIASMVDHLGSPGARRSRRHPLAKPVVRETEAAEGVLIGIVRLRQHDERQTSGPSRVSDLYDRVVFASQAIHRTSTYPPDSTDGRIGPYRRDSGLSPGLYRRL